VSVSDSSWLDCSRKLEIVKGSKVRYARLVCKLDRAQALCTHSPALQAALLQLAALNKGAWLYWRPAHERGGEKLQNEDGFAGRTDSNEEGKRLPTYP